MKPTTGYSVDTMSGDADHERYMTEIQTEYEKDIADAKKKADAATEVENKRCEKEQIKKDYDLYAFRQRTYYDALIANGFSEEQAWELTVKCFASFYSLPSYAVV